jgi:dipeptidyl aminopeptidase/acylaminoacyl peptidase
MKKLPIVSLFLLAASLCFAQSQPGAPFTLEQVMGSPFPDGLTAAAKAGRIVWEFSSKGANNIWAADAPNFEARQVTHYVDDEGLPMNDLKLTPDGRTAVYRRGTEVNSAGEVADPTSGTEKRMPQVWAVDVAKGEPRLLGEKGCHDLQISPDGQFAVWSDRKQLWIAPVSGKEKVKLLTFARGDSQEPRWSPDSKKIAFVSQRGDHSFIAIYEFGHDHLHFLAPSADRDVFPRWSADGTQLAFIRAPGEMQKRPLIPQTPLPWAIWVYDFAQDSAHEIWKSGPGLDDSLPTGTAGDSFYFAGKNRIVFGSEQDGWNHLYSVVANGGPATLLTPGEFEIEDVTLSTDGNSVIYSSNQNDIDRRHLWQVNVEGGIPVALTHGETMEWTPVEVAGQIVCLGSTATSPAMPYVIKDQQRRMIAGDAIPADFPSAQLVTPRQVLFKAADGLEIHGQLFEKTPSNTANAEAKRPALIFIHGGSERQMMLGFHYMDYYHNAYAMNEYLASRGYVVLSVNYRTGTMYGRHFREVKDGGPRGAAEYQDIVAAGHYLQSLPEVDSKRIGLWGGSYGGFLTAMGLARDSTLFAVGVDLHGVHDWTGERKSSIPSDAPDHDAYVKLAYQSSPNAYIDTWKSPVLLIQGDDDRNVNFSQTVDLLQRLREHNIPVEQLVFPDEVHGFLLWHNWIQAYHATESFFARKLNVQQ